MRWPWSKPAQPRPVVAKPQSVRVTIEHDWHLWIHAGNGGGGPAFVSAGYGREPMPRPGAAIAFDLDVRLSERELAGVEVLKRTRPDLLSRLFVDDRQVLGGLEDDVEEMRRARAVWAALDAYAVAGRPEAGSVHDAMIAALDALDLFYRDHPERAAAVRG